jgi:hypothetical protein
MRRAEWISVRQAAGNTWQNSRLVGEVLALLQVGFFAPIGAASMISLPESAWSAV